MKTNLILLTFLILFFKLSAQENPNLRVKQGYAFYEFNNKFDNKKKCINYYLISDNNILQQFTRDLQSKNTVSNSPYKQTRETHMYIPSVQQYNQTMNNKQEIKCVDTNSFGKISFTQVKPVFFLAKVKSGRNYEAVINVIATSKNDINIIFKDIIIMKIGSSERISLSDFLKRKESNKLKKSELIFLNRIHEDLVYLNDRIVYNINQSILSNDN